MIPLVKKNWVLYQATARFPVETIYKVTAWLEERYHKSPCRKIALAIAVHYLILAIRHEDGMKSQGAQEYCACAVYWQTLAYDNSGRNLPTTSTNEN